MTKKTSPLTDELPDAVDVVIIGAGITGTAAGYFLATETDLDVLIIDKSSLASGSTGDSVGVIRHHYGPDTQYTELAHWSHQFYQNFEDKTGEPITYEQCPLVHFVRSGTEKEKYAMEGKEVLKNYDIPVSVYVSEEFDEQYPYLELDEYDFAVSDDTAAYSDATDATNGFARSATRSGAILKTGTAVTDILIENGSVIGIETEVGRVDTANVLIAAGPWTESVADWIGVEVPLTTSREQVIVLNPEDDSFDHHRHLPMTALPGDVWTVRPEFGGHVVAATHHVGDNVNPEAYEKMPDEERILELLDHLEQMAPRLTDSRIIGKYCGVYSNTPDHDFVIDQIGPDGCYVACGFSGHGFKHAPAVGKIVADLMTTGGTDLTDISRFSLSRFDR